LFRSEARIAEPEKNSAFRESTFVSLKIRMAAPFDGADEN